MDVPAEFRSLVQEFGIGGVTLFGRLGNIEDPEQLAALSFDIRRLVAGHTPWVAIDQEGGRVRRLRAPFTAWPPMALLGRSDKPGLAARFARALAAEMAAVGISLDYAPVLDIRTNPKNDVIGDRAFGDRPEIVARFGRIVVEELQRAGVAACGKHFPGHGDTSTDSHFELPIVDLPPDRLRAVEFVPFKAAIDANVAFIMTAHVLVPSLDDERPATLSRRIVHDLLRDELAFGGVIVSDDLEMKAIANGYTPGEAAVGAIAAGCDALLMCGEGAVVSIERQVEMLEALIHAVEDERLSVGRVDDALARNARARQRFHRDWRPPSPAQIRSIVGCEPHQMIADEMTSFA